MRASFFFFTSLLVTSCSSSSESPAREWLTVENVPNDEGVVVEKVSYRSGAYRVLGQVCRPTAAGRYPLFVINHGGFEGLTAEWNKGSQCRKSASNGYVTIEAAYRGEDGSEGSIEVCLGEVDDVMAMIDIARAQPYVDPNRVGMLGVSHGGCIALRALQRGAPVNITVEFAGPTDWAALHQQWIADMPNAPPALREFYRVHLDPLLKATGGTPAERPEEFRKRSPLAFAADLERVTGSIAMLQGGADKIVTADHTCKMGAALSSVRAYHLDAQSKEITLAPAGCPGSSWTAGPRPKGAWPDSRYMVIYDDVGHGFEGAAGAAAVEDMWGILAAKFPPRP